MPSIFLYIYVLVLVISNTSVLIRQNSIVTISYHSSTRLYKAVIDFQNFLEKLDLIEMPCLPLYVPTFPKIPSRHWAVEELDLFPTRLLAA